MRTTGGSAVLSLLVLLGCSTRDASTAPAAAMNVAQDRAPAARAATPPVDLTGYRTAYDFAANRVHALVHHDARLVVAGGELEFLKLIDGGWKSAWILGDKVDGRAVAHVSGLSASFVVPLDQDGDGPRGAGAGDVKLALTLRAAIPGQRLSIFANEKAMSTIEVAQDWQTYEIAVPAAALVAGENRFRLTFRGAGPIAGGKRSAAAVASIVVSPAQAAAAPVPPPMAPAEVKAGGAARRALSFPGPSRLSYYVQVPQDAKLAAAFAAPRDGTTVLVRVARDGADPVTLHDGPATTAWTESAWDLSAFAGHAVRVDLVSRGGGVSWAAPRLVVKAPVAEAPAPKKFDRIFVWMVDTLRADKLRVYNPKSVVETPHFDAFAADATRFAWAHVPGTWSLPSHASILTGVYPTVHKANAHEAKLSRDVDMVTELLQKSGYRTGLFSSNGYISGKWGFDRSWDESRNFIRESLPNGAEYLWKTAKTWLFAPANKDKPLFAYLATVEPHVIYNPKKEWLDRYWKKPYTGPIKPVMTGIQLGQIKTGKLKINDTDKAFLQALYDAEVAQADHAFGNFVADLKAAGVYDSSVVIVISDHGDEFWEHGDVGHAQSVHQELVHIPLIIRAPGAMPAGKVVESDVEAMDVFPTMLELAGIKPPPAIQGSSLLALAHDEVGNSPRPALTQNAGVSRGMKVGRYRFIHAGARLGLFDVVEDALEQKDVVATRPIALRQMRNVFALLMAYESRWKKHAWGTAANVDEAFYEQAGP